MGNTIATITVITATIPQITEAIIKNNNKSF